MAKKEVSISGKMEKARVIEHLDKLVRSLRDGSVYVQQGSDYVGLNPAEFVDFELDASSRKNKETLELKLSWRKVESIDETEDVTISSEKPEVPEPAITETAAAADADVIA